MSTVFVVQENGKIDISPALDYGDIHVLLPPGDTNFSYPFVAQKIQQDVDLLAKPGDYLLLTGDPVAIGLASIALNRTLAKFGGAKLQFLKWMPRESRYLSISVPAEAA